MKEQIKYDKRLIDRNIRRGHLTSEEYRTHMEALKDLSDKAQLIESKLESTYGEKEGEGEESGEGSK